MDKPKKIKLAKKDKALLEKQLGFHKAGVEYKDTWHTQNIYRSEVKQDFLGHVYR